MNFVGGVLSSSCVNTPTVAHGGRPYVTNPVLMARRPIIPSTRYCVPDVLRIYQVYTLDMSCVYIHMLYARYKLMV